MTKRHAGSRLRRYFLEVVDTGEWIEIHAISVLHAQDQVVALLGRTTQLNFVRSCSI